MSEKSSPVYIYQAVNPITGKLYVGLTQNFKKRLSRHFSKMQSGYKTVFYDALRSYGWSNFEWRIVETCANREIANVRERFWIKVCSSIIPNGYNMTEGGDGTPVKGRVNSREVIDKVANFNRGKPLSDSRKQKISESKRLSSNLTEIVVREIRSRYKNGETLADLIKDYPCSKTTIFRIVHNKTWVGV